MPAPVEECDLCDGLPGERGATGVDSGLPSRKSVRVCGSGALRSRLCSSLSFFWSTSLGSLVSYMPLALGSLELLLRPFHAAPIHSDLRRYG